MERERNLKNKDDEYSQLMKSLGKAENEIEHSSYPMNFGPAGSPDLARNHNDTFGVS